MCKSFRNQKLFLVFSCQFNAIPFSICFRITSKINRNIKYRTSYCSNKFTLRKMLLEMQASQYTFYRHRLIILYKINIKSSFLHIIFIICFHEVTSVISMHCWCNDTQAFNSTNILFNTDLSHIKDSPYLIHQYIFLTHPAM